MRRALFLCCFLAACSGADIERVSGPMPEDVPAIAAAPDPIVEETAPNASAAAPDETQLQPPRGFLGRLIARRAARAAALEEADALIEGEEPEAETSPEAEEPAPPMSDASEAEEPTEQVEAEASRPQRPGFFASLLSRRAPQGEAIVAPGTDLPYGVVVTSCGTARSDLGTEVSRYPERGAGYRLYDSDPSSTALRNHYITGFKDGCPRRFVAALAIFGGVQAYETTRYEDGRNTTTVTETDRLYKQIRRRVCGVPVGTTCPERRFEKLGRDAVFVSVYERFGTAPTWADMLIYDGEVAAKDFKSIR